MVTMVEVGYGHSGWGIGYGHFCRGSAWLLWQGYVAGCVSYNDKSSCHEWPMNI